MVNRVRDYARRHALRVPTDFGGEHISVSTNILRNWKMEISASLSLSIEKEGDFLIKYLLGSFHKRLYEIRHNDLPS